MCYVSPAYIGPALSKEEIGHWDYMKSVKMYRDPEYKFYIHEWREYIMKCMNKYPVKPSHKRLIKEILTDSDRSSLEYVMWKQLDTMMRSSLTVISNKR